MTQYPIKEFLFTLFVIYLTIFFNYIRFDHDLEEIVRSYPQLIYLFIFCLSVITMGFSEKYTVSTQLFFSGLVVVIFYFTTSLRISQSE